MKVRLSRRAFLFSAGGIEAAAAAAGGYARWIEPGCLEVSRREVPARGGAGAPFACCTFPICT